MQLFKTLIMLSVTSGLSLGASLALYQDSTLYSVSSKDTFIGFTRNITAKCKGDAIPLVSRSVCPEEERLCKEHSGLKVLAEKRKAIEANIALLDTFVSLPQPTAFDAEKWIEAAERIGREKAKLFTKAYDLKQRYLLEEKAFKKQISSETPLYLQKSCTDELELTLPYGQVTFSVQYEADIGKGSEIEVAQYLSVTNRSGIDIEAENAMFYYRRAHRHISPVHFSPWIVKKYTAGTKRTFNKSMPRTLRAQRLPAVNMRVADTPTPTADYLSAREYRVKDLSLPSTGEPLNVKVTSWKAPLTCGLMVYPYRDTTAFTVCSFKPKKQIERNSWKIRSGEKHLNDRAVGEYDGGVYHLYTEAELNIKTRRKPLVQRERTTGIFGTTARKRDGYTLVFTNKSDKEKKLTVVERIPTSATEEIEAKLLSITSVKKVDYTVSKEGKIEMHIVLKAHETKTIEVLFELSYDKALKIKY